MPTDNQESAEAGAEIPPRSDYSDVTEAYLEAATWLGVFDGPFIIQARMVARSLDSQLTNAGEVQSALASTYLKVMQQLDQRKPPAAPAPTDPAAAGPDGTGSIFGLLDGS